MVYPPQDFKSKCKVGLGFGKALNSRFCRGAGDAGSANPSVAKRISSTVLSTATLRAAGGAAERELLGRLFSQVLTRAFCCSHA